MTKITDIIYTLSLLPIFTNNENARISVNFVSENKAVFFLPKLTDLHRIMSPDPCRIHGPK